MLDGIWSKRLRINLLKQKQLLLTVLYGRKGSDITDDTTLLLIRKANFFFLTFTLSFQFLYVSLHKICAILTNMLRVGQLAIRGYFRWRCRGCPIIGDPIALWILMMYFPYGEASGSKVDLTPREGILNLFQAILLLLFHYFSHDHSK